MATRLWNPSNVLGLVGTMLFLIALYLVLERGRESSRLIASVASGSTQVFRTLQGR